MQLRYFFDPGSGVCLWASDDEARDAFDYAVALEDLPLSAAARALGNALLQSFDGSINWNDPGSPTIWSAAQLEEFNANAQAYLSRLRTELGDGFVIVDASSASPSA